MNSHPSHTPSGPTVSECGKFYLNGRGEWIPVPLTQNPFPQHVLPLKSRGVYVLLALLLGGLGIHNFYAGRFGCAIAQLLITLLTGWLIIPLLIVGLWALIEACIVTTDGENRRFA